MVNHKRRKRLLKLLAEHQTATVQQLVEWLSASPATVRRDISWLASRNLLTRTRGGAENLPPKRRHFALSSETFENNIQCHAARKRAIARYAAGLCADGETIIINGGTTTFMMAEFLADKHRSFGFDAAVSAQGLSDFRDKVEAARRDTASVRRLVAAGLEIRMGHCRSFTEKFVQGVRRAAGLPPTGQLDDAVQDEVEAAMYRVEEDALAAHPHVQAAVERENAAINDWLQADDAAALYGDADPRTPAQRAADEDWQDEQNTREAVRPGY